MLTQCGDFESLVQMSNKDTDDIWTYDKDINLVN